MSPRGNKRRQVNSDLSRGRMAINRDGERRVGERDE